MAVSEFRDRTGLSVRLVQSGTGELFSRLRAELSGGGGGPCDVFWGGGAESHAANADLFEPYRSREAEAIPDAYKDPAGRWTGFTVLPMAIGYNGRLLSDAEAPHSFADLLKPRFRGAIAFADPRVSASSYTILRTLGAALSASGAMRREDAERAFALALEGKVLPESAAVFPAVASGEYLAGLYHDEGARELLGRGSDLKIVFPADGTSAVPDCIALVRGAAHPEAAKRFIDFALGRDVALVVAKRFHRRSVRTDCPPPEGQVPVSALRLVGYDIAEAAAAKEKTLERFFACMASVTKLVVP